MDNGYKILKFIKSEGKRPERNDDFVYAANIANTRGVGVLGDFTSDSRPGINESCKNNDNG